MNIKYQKVCGSHEIAARIADLLDGPGGDGDRARAIRDYNDILQRRSAVSLETLSWAMAEQYGAEAAPILEDIRRFLWQKALRRQPYTLAGNHTYEYLIWDFGTAHPLKIVDQRHFDHAAEHGFPPDFFTNSYFDRVTIFCMPDGADCSGSHFEGCRFAVCGVRGAAFDNARLSDTLFDTALLRMVNFTGASLSNVRFRDSELTSVSFQDAELRHCQVTDCTLRRVDFLGTVLDGSSFGRVKTDTILNLQHTSITAGGATAAEVQRLRASVFRELGAVHRPARRRPPTPRER